MGCCGSSNLTPEEEELLRNSQALGKSLKALQYKEDKVLKILLLGTGESGKSTIFKQMQILHSVGFDEYEQNIFKHVLRKNTLECMQVLIRGCGQFEIEMEEHVIEDAKILASLDPLTSDFWHEDTADMISKLWQEESILETYERRSELQLLDSAEYLFNNLDRIGDPNFVPTAEDILRARLRTSGIVERLFTIDDAKFKFLDVGGQQNERRKWIHCFDQVTAILFIVAVSEFDQVLYENDTKNRMQESMEVWRKIAGEPTFINTALILFFNKHDIFTEKMKDPASHDKLREIFPDYKGNTQEEAETLIENAYLDIQKEVEPDREDDKKIERCSHRFTTATDTGHVAQVFDSCKMVITQFNLIRCGMM